VRGAQAAAHPDPQLSGQINNLLTQLRAFDERMRQLEQRMVVCPNVEYCMTAVNTTPRGRLSCPCAICEMFVSSTLCGPAIRNAFPLSPFGPRRC
jgi:hypothetical protein